MKKYLLLLALLAAVACGPKKQNDEQNQLIEVSLRQEWFPNANYAGELFAVNVTGKKYGLKIRLDAGSDQIDPVKMVLSGENDFGIVSADRILTANQNGADLVVIGVANQNTPTCFISKAEKNIKTPKDFEGNTVGILTGTNTELVYKILLKKAGIDQSKIKEVEIPFDLGTFIAGKYDVRPAFVYDEPVSLDKQGIKYNIIKPEDFSVNFLGTVYFTKRKTVNESPEKVQAFINAIADGWLEAAKSPKGGIDMLKQYDSNIDATREMFSLQKALPYFSGPNRKILTCSLSKWLSMEQDLIDLKVLEKPLATNSIDSTFVTKFNSNQ